MSKEKIIKTKKTKKIPCEVYSRVVGYYRPVQNWNNGKKEEFHHRVEFEEEPSLNSPVKLKEIKCAAD